MPYKDKAVQSAYQGRIIQERREQWFRENGPCKHCGSWENLEADHVDPAEKFTHRIWSYSLERRIVELAKCQVLCRSCHEEKSSEESRVRNVVKRITGAVGTAWCNSGRHFAAIARFTRNVARWNGLEQECRTALLQLSVVSYSHVATIIRKDSS